MMQGHGANREPSQAPQPILHPSRGVCPPRPHKPRYLDSHCLHVNTERPSSTPHATKRTKLSIPNRAQCL